NFGIVTTFEFAAHPTTDVFHGRITFPASETATVLRGWATYLRTAPEELTSTANVANPFAGGPEAPVEIHVVVDSDDPELAGRVLDPVRRLGRVIDDAVARKAYADVLEDGMTPPPGIEIMTKSAFVEPESVDDAVRLLAEIGTSERSPFIALRSVGGAVSRVPDQATAYAHRRAELMLVTTTVGPQPVLDAARPGPDAIWGRMAPHVNGAYANFLTTAADEDVAAVYPSQTYDRLAAIKRRYDPDNLFVRNHNIRPRGAWQ